MDLDAIVKAKPLGNHEKCSSLAGMSPNRVWKVFLTVFALSFNCKNQQIAMYAEPFLLILFGLNCYVLFIDNFKITVRTPGPEYLNFY